MLESLHEIKIQIEKEPNEKPVEVHYTVLIEVKDFETLYKEGRQLGHAYEDTGCILTIQRYLMAEGVDGVFHNERSLGLEFILHKTKSNV